MAEGNETGADCPDTQATKQAPATQPATQSSRAPGLARYTSQGTLIVDPETQEIDDDEVFVRQSARYFGFRSQK